MRRTNYSIGYIQYRYPTGDDWSFWIWNGVMNGVMIGYDYNNTEDKYKKFIV